MDPLRLLWASAALLLGTSCAGDAEFPPHQTPDDGPLYLVSGAVPTVDSTISVFALVPSLDASVTPDLETSASVDGFAVALATDGAGSIFVAAAESGEIVKWTLGDDGLFPGSRLSLQGFGITSAVAGKVVILSPTKAYYIPIQQAREIIVFDPQTMTITGQFELGLPAIEGFATVTVPDTFVLRDDGTLVISTFYSSDYGLVFGDRVVVTAIDTASDEVTASDEDDRCGASWFMQEATDGTLYISGHVPHEVYRTFDSRAGAEVCQLRVLPPGSEFDDGYFVDLSTLTGGRPTGDFLLIDDDTAGILAFHEEDATPSDDIFEYTFQNAYRWYLWDFDDAEATLVQTGNPGSVAGRRFFIDDVWYFQEENLVDLEGRNDSTLLTLAADGDFSRGLTFPGGQIRNVLRLR